MRGDFISVWPETWADIWLPLIAQENVPDDIFCELYRELTRALKIPTIELAVELALKDAIQLGEVLDRMLVLSAAEVERAQRDNLYDRALSVDASNSTSRRKVLKDALANLVASEVRSEELLSQGLREIASDAKKRKDVWERSLESVVNDKEQSQYAFEHTVADQIVGERSLVTFLESVQTTIYDIGGDELSNHYFGLLTGFIEKFSLRYDLRRPCTLCPTLPGIFASLIRDLRVIASRDAHLDGLFQDYENAIRDLRTDCSDTRIKTCIVKQVNLLEAMGSRSPGVTANTVGQICEQLGTWPHNSVKDAMKNLYKFTCNYPGIRHAGTPASALRIIEMRDMVAMSILLAGFMPYLTDQLDANLVYRGS